MLLGVLWRDDNGIDWNYNKIEEHGKGENYEESKEILIKSLDLVYDQKIIKNRPADRSKNVILKYPESYVIDPNIDKVTVGVGWDSALIGNIDIDGSVIVFDRIGDELVLNEIIGGKYKLHMGDMIRHHGDSGDGKGAGDDEVIDMWLNKMKSDKIDILCIIININSGANSFKGVSNCFARLVDDKGKELCKFPLSGDSYNTRGVIMCTICKQNNGCWKLKSAGIGVGGTRAKQSVDACKKWCMGQHLSDKDRSTDECCVIL